MKLLIATLLLLSLSACTHSMIMKECKAVSDSEQYVCRTIKPWE